MVGYVAFTYIYSPLIGKEICDCRNVSVKFTCVFCVSFVRSLHVLHTPTHARTHARTHTHTHIHICKFYIYNLPICVVNIKTLIKVMPA